MRIFGNVLPFLGFRRLTEDDRKALELPRIPGHYWQGFEVEWLNVGMLVWAKAMRDADPTPSP